MNSYKSEYNPTNRKRWVRLEDKKHKKTEFKIMQTTEEYLWEGGGRDCSIDEGININVPSRELIRGMGITHSQDVSKFINKNSELVAMDPSVEEQGPSVLLFNKKPFLEFLKKNYYEIIWAIMGEKLLLGTSGGGPDFLGRLEMRGAFRMSSNGKIQGKTYTKKLPPHKY